MKYILMTALLVFNINIKLVSAFEANSQQGKDNGEIRLPNPLGDPNMTISDLIAQVIRGGLGIVGSITLLVFIYGGFLWLTSAGDGKKVEQGKNILLWSTVGLAIIFSSYALVKFVITSIGG